jgi:MOSC domain-containing protein YiiM
VSLWPRTLPVVKIALLSREVSELLKIWVKRFRRGPMDPVLRATMVAGRGIAGDANQGSTRQVTVLSDRDWIELTAGPGTPDPIVRRANLLVSDVDLLNSRSKILQVGSVRIRLLGETRPCERMEEAKTGLRAAMSVPYGGGAFGEVLDDGEIAVGDEVRLYESDDLVKWRSDDRSADLEISRSGDRSEDLS